jgi:predicted nucleic acid-binding protein
LILLSDANVLIDLGYVGGLAVLTQLGQVEVLDVVFDECCHPSQPALPGAIEAAGIQRVTALREWGQLAQPYRTKNLSSQDALCLYYAKTYQRLLLTNEKPLRKCCEEQQVMVHGTLWIIQMVYEQQIVKASELCEWLIILSRYNRRLPKSDVTRLKQRLGC